jgi:hypothetical protein
MAEQLEQNENLVVIVEVALIGIQWVYISFGVVVIWW